MTTFIARKRVAAVSGVALAVVVGGGAFAFWTQGGSGTGTAQTGDIVPITINQTASSDAALYPGGPATTLSGNYTNTNAGKVQVHEITVAVKPSWTSQADKAKPACTAADFTGSKITVDAEIDPGKNVNSWTGLTLKLDDLAANQDNCKGVTPDLVYASN